MVEPIQSDKTKTDKLEPIIINPTSLNTFDDPDLIKNEELQSATAVVLENGMVEKIKGTNRIYLNAAATPVYGLHRAYGSGSQKYTLYLCNGTLNVTTDFAALTALASGLASQLTPFVNVQNIAYGVNIVNGIIRYDPRLTTLATPTNSGAAMTTGMYGPNQIKKVAFFETDETWTQNAGMVAVNYGTVRSDEFSGNAMRSLKFTAAASATAQGTMNYATTLDLTTFGNSITSNTDDQIRFQIFFDVYNNFDYMTLEFSAVDTAFTDKYTFTVYAINLKNVNYVWNEIIAQKSDFVIAGAPSWATIKAARITVYANANGPLSLWTDYVSMKSCPPLTFVFRKVIRTFDSDESWAVTAGGGTVVIDNQYTKEGISSRKITNAGADTTDIKSTFTAIDLSTWPDNSVISASDQVCFWARHTTRANITSIEVQLGTTDAVYYKYTYPVASLTAGDNAWTEIKLMKSVFTAVGGIASWAGIVQCKFSFITTGAAAIYLDDLRIEKYSASTQIATMENTETWVASPTGYAFGSTANVSQGSESLCMLMLAAGSTGTYNCPTTDLSQWAGGFESTTADHIYFTLFTSVDPKANLTSLTLYLDCNAFDFATDYYYYVFTPSNTTMVSSKMNYISIPKSKFTRVGATGGKGWNTIEGVRFKAVGSFYRSIYLDDLKMVRTVSKSGIYTYKYVYTINDVKSACSLESQSINVADNFVQIYGIKASDDTRVQAREVYRKGGTYPDTWKLVKLIPDNTTTAFMDEVGDNDLGGQLLEDSPSGKTDLILCSNLTYNQPDDRMLYWGDPNFKNRIYYSNEAFYHSVPENNFRDMPDEVMFVQPHFGNIFVFFKNQVKKIAGSIVDGALIDLASTDGACSYYAVCKGPGGSLIHVGWNNVYLFNGYDSLPIGDEIKDQIFNKTGTQLAGVTLVYHKRILYLKLYSTTNYRYYFETKSWSRLPATWLPNVFTKYDQMDDTNQLAWGDSADGSVFTIDYDVYTHDAVAINFEFQTKWFNVPDAELRVNRLEFEAKGVVGTGGADCGTMTISCYKDHSAVATYTITVPSAGTIPTTWTKYTVLFYAQKPFQGDSISFKFVDAATNAKIFVKNIMLYMEKASKRDASFHQLSVT